MDQSYIARNQEARERLRALAERLTDEELRREVRDGWTVSALLAHLAFLDRLRLVGWEAQERRGTEERLRFFSTQEEQDVINAASLPLMLAILPIEAVRIALDAAEAVDNKIAGLDPALVEAYLVGADRHEHRMLDRSIHRKSHLDDIEAALSR